MQIDVMNRPAAACVRIGLSPGEKVIAETGAMIALSGGVRTETTSQTRGGGFLSGLKRVLAGESLFLNHFTGEKDGAQVLFAPPLAGDILHHTLRGGRLIVQGSSWLCSSGDIHIDATWQGFGKALFSGESMFWVNLSGTGDVVLSSFGGVFTVDVDGDYVVDTGHIVAFEDTLQFKIGKASDSLIGSFLGGEGLVCKFNGKGRLWCQTHNPPAFGKEMTAYLKPVRR